MFIVVTMYAEDPEELSRTLRGICKNVAALARDKTRRSGVPAWHEVCVCIVSDGRSKAKATTLEYMRKTLNLYDGALLDHAGLPWHEDCLNFHASDRVTKTASRDQVHRPIYATSKGRSPSLHSTSAGLRASRVSEGVPWTTSASQASASEGSTVSPTTIESADSRLYGLLTLRLCSRGEPVSAIARACSATAAYTSLCTSMLMETSDVQPSRSDARTRSGTPSKSVRAWPSWAVR